MTLVDSPSVDRAVPENLVRDTLAAPSVLRAFKLFESQSKRITEEHVRVCSIPAPPFGERARAEYLRQRFFELGLIDSGIDEEGNCLALRRGRSDSPLLAVSAHLDTVFPAGTDFTVRRVGDKLFAPGIADDGCGLAALIALVDVMQSCAIETRGSLLFAGTVGEEGEGNLRGVRYMFTRGKWAAQIDSFISFDGPGLARITNAALGSRRYRALINGSGGHSWADFGVANPVHALGRAIARLASYPAPLDPRTTFNVGRIEGGAGTNVIPRQASMDVDLRSTSMDELRRLDAFFRRAVNEALEDENSSFRTSGPPLELDLRLIGDRPSGETAPESQIVRIAEEATRALGYRPWLDRSSTDSNIPISLGIPAITLGAGGSFGDSHTTSEWFDTRERDIGLKRALLVMLAIAGLS